MTPASARAIAYRASWLWAGPGELRAGVWVVVENGRVRELCRRPPADARREDLGEGLILPGLVNAHTHLELSFLAGAVPPPAGDFVGWLEALVAARPGHDHQAAEVAVESAVRQALASGTVLVGDITNTGRARQIARRAGLHALSLFEAIGPSRAEPPAPELTWQEGVLSAQAVAAHAPYSIPAWRMRALKAKAGAMTFCIHLAESRAEMEYLAGEGAEGQRLAGFLRGRGLMRDSLDLQAARPLDHLLALGVVDQRTLLVHGVQLDRDELRRVAQAGASLCVCPRSNLGLTGAIADVAAAQRQGVNLCLGTDSLASTPDLSLWGEMAAVRTACPDLEPEAILAMATAGGAQALGLAGHFGFIQPGAIADLILLPLASTADSDIICAAVEGRHAGPPRRLFLGGVHASLPTSTRL
ncbi:MAG: amidohydrolase family protein [Thermodesulfobacteriota bacterium]